MEDPEEIGSALSDQEIRLVHSLADFQQALSALTFIAELGPDQSLSRVELRRYRCIEDAAVVAYWRPFSKSHGLPTLSLKKLGIKPTRDESRLHDDLKAHRDKVVAHTDIGRMRLAFRASKPFEDRDVVLPQLTRDDSLAFYNRRAEWVRWLKKLIDAGSREVFERVQLLGEVNFRRDYLRDTDPS